MPTGTGKFTIVFYLIIPEAIYIVHVNENQSPRSIKNHSGFSLIEVIIAFGLMGFLALVMSSLFSDMYKAQKQTNVVNTIEQMRLNIIKLTNDGGPWRKTIEQSDNATVFDCLITQTPCDDSGATTMSSGDSTSNAVLDAAPFISLPRLQNGSGTTAADTYINNTSGTRGFTDRGEPCNTFNPDPAVGNDACPIRWSIRFAYECPGGTGSTCMNPITRVLGILYYHPTPNNPMKSVINPIKYRVDVKRGAQGDVRSEMLHVEYRGAGAAHGGNCASTGTDIPFNNIILNTNGNLLTGAGASMTFAPGTYSCSASSGCFACENLRIEILAGGDVKGSSISVPAPDWVAGQVSTSQVVFTLNANTTINVRQYCAKPPFSADGNVIATMGLGIAAPPYTGTKFAELLCTRMF